MSVRPTRPATAPSVGRDRSKRAAASVRSRIRHCSDAIPVAAGNARSTVRAHVGGPGELVHGRGVAGAEAQGAGMVSAASVVGKGG